MICTISKKFQLSQKYYQDFSSKILPLQKSFEAWQRGTILAYYEKWIAFKNDREVFSRKMSPENNLLQKVVQALKRPNEILDQLFFFSY